jgi:hypothetical protein
MPGGAGLKHGNWYAWHTEPIYRATRSRHAANALTG